MVFARECGSTTKVGGVGRHGGNAKLPGCGERLDKLHWIVRAIANDLYGSGDRLFVDGGGL